MADRRDLRGLAAKTGLSAGYLNHLVHGNRPVPSNEVLERLATALEVDPDHFLEYRLRVITEQLAQGASTWSIASTSGSVNQLTESAEWVDGGAAYPHLEVEVRACRAPRRADGAEPGSERDAVEQADIDLLEMRVERPDAAAVRDDDRVAEAAQRPRPNHTAGTCGRHRRAGGGHEVEAGMERPARPEPIARTLRQPAG